MRLDVDPEGVHQARVASRRLRSDLRTFRTTLDPTWAEPLRVELRWLGTVLGDARDADVLLDRVRGRAGTIPSPEAPGAADVIEALEHRRKEAHVALIEALRGDRYITLLDRIVEAARAPAVLPDADVPARGIAADLLRGPWRHLRQAVRSAGKHPSDDELHTIRIRAKRVRYAADTLAPLMGKSARPSRRPRPDCRSCSASTTTRWSPRPGSGRGPPVIGRAMQPSRRGCSPGSSARPPSRPGPVGGRPGSLASAWEEL